MIDLPRFFLASAGAPVVASAPSWVIDRFVHVTPQLAREVIVGLDAAGALRVEALAGDDERLSSLRTHLAHAEVATPQRRGLESAPDGLWILALDLVEQLPDAPGMNDLVYLYGTLYDMAGGDGVKGQLTTTRADLLRGLADGMPFAFRYPPDAHERVPRALHALLPADRPEALGAGRGMVLAYPIVDPALLGDNAANELAALAIFHDLLAAMAADPERPRAAVREPVPVPDRAAFVADLEAQGWELAAGGERATREPPGAGVLKRMFTEREELRLPAQGTIEIYATRTHAELAALPGWPSEASRLLFARVQAPFKGALGAFGTARPAPPLRPPAPPAPPAPRPPPAAAPRASRDDWMQDFIGQHREHRPRLTPVGRSDAGKRTRPDWMNDFD